MKRNNILLKRLLILGFVQLGLSFSGFSQKGGTYWMNSIPYPLFIRNSPVNVTVKNDSILLEAGANTDMFIDPEALYTIDNAPKLLFYPDSNFVLIASVKHDFESKWDGAALVIYVDSAHWVKFCYEKDYTGAHRVVSVVTREISDDCNSIAFTSDKVYFKVARFGNAMALYCSENGNSWFLIRNFLFKTTSGLSVGFLAQSPTGKNCKAYFADIKYMPVKIKDPFAGE